MQAGGPVNTRKVLTNESVDPNIFCLVKTFLALVAALSFALSLALVLLYYGM